jgi:hypothetical protein
MVWATSNHVKTKILLMRTVIVMIWQLISIHNLRGLVVRFLFIHLELLSIKQARKARHKLIIHEAPSYTYSSYAIIIYNVYVPMPFIPSSREIRAIKNLVATSWSDAVVGAAGSYWALW